jgi:vitamin K-dependent gamma-carboxylase
MTTERQKRRTSTRRSPAQGRSRASVPPLSSRLLSLAFAPVDIAWLAYFRIAFGSLMTLEVWRYFQRGWVAQQFAAREFSFSYPGFHWVRPLPDPWISGLFLCLGLCAVSVALGLCYRLAIAIFWLGFSYLFLCDASRYLNHFYLIGLVSFLMMFLPAERACSLDVWLRVTARSSHVHAWMLWLLRSQIAIVYFYGGLAKLNGDWLRGQPLGIWLGRAQLGEWLGWLREPWAAYLFSYGGLIFDLVIVPLLLWRRTRHLALALSVGFHVLNSQLFQIGIFPWFMLAATLLFLPPDWPKFVWSRRLEHLPPSMMGPLSAAQRRTAMLVGAYLVVQALLPLRHWLYPGPTNWTQQADRFSWRMKLSDTRGSVMFYAFDPATRLRWKVEPREALAPYQLEEMSTRPDMILEYAHFVADGFRRRGFPRIQVRAVARTSLNGRPPQLLVDPKIDLAAQRRTLFHASFIVPFQGGLVPTPGQAVPPLDRDPRRAPAVALLFGERQSL